MPLSPPPDHTRTYFAGAIGVCVALCLYTLTRSTLPHVGDNIHSLPHGGCYQDGTKRIFYNRPAKNFPSSNLPLSFTSPVLLLGILIGLIFLSEKIRSSSRTRMTCSCNHS
ncbi:TGB2 protein [Garlic latent virus]|uniref:Movement protein TGB2 n=1 Tax=Garlic latent virus TaxID=12458 RepID=Q8QXY6_9VIRU|nr:TGB2 protein [Garlic latent virus]CAC83716.1 TGB2 protein [Garlic latent virus]